VHGVLHGATPSLILMIREWVRIPCQALSRDDWAVETALANFAPSWRAR